jgi:hypothetical protein
MAALAVEAAASMEKQNATLLSHTCLEKRPSQKTARSLFHSYHSDYDGHVTTEGFKKRKTEKKRLTRKTT